MNTTTDWYVYRNQQRWGPFSWQQMLEMALGGNITPTDQLWHPQYPNFINANQVQGLFESSRLGLNKVVGGKAPLPVAGPIISELPIPATPGNTSGNYNNDAEAVIYGDCIFYVTLDIRLFKMKLDGTSSQDTGLVSSHRYRELSSLSIIDRTLYYVINDWSDSTPGISIYKTELGLESKETEPSHYTPKCIFSDSKEHNFRKAMVVGNWIFYSSTDGLFKVDTYGKRHQKLATGWINYFGVVGDSIYFQLDPLFARKDQLHTIGTDGTNEQIILPINKQLVKRLNTNDYSYSDLYISGDWFYYTSYVPSFGKRVIHKARIDGSEETILNNNECYGFNVIGDWIYFINDSDERRLYRIKTDGSNETCINDQTNIAKIFDLDGIILCYCSTKELPGKLVSIFSIQPDGSNYLKLF
jgi:hypothetical protein